MIAGSGRLLQTNIKMHIHRFNHRPRISAGVFALALVVYYIVSTKISLQWRGINVGHFRQNQIPDESIRDILNSTLGVSFQAVLFEL